MFKREFYRFNWKDLGDIEAGRPNLGNLMNVAVSTGSCSIPCGMC
jgi:hypothetical protein